MPEYAIFPTVLSLICLPCFILFGILLHIVRKEEEDEYIKSLAKPRLSVWLGGSHIKCHSSSSWRSGWGSSYESAYKDWRGKMLEREQLIILIN